MDSWLRQLQNKTQDDIAKKKEKKNEKYLLLFCHSRNLRGYLV